MNFEVLNLVLKYCVECSVFPLQPNDEKITSLVNWFPNIHQTSAKITLQVESAPEA